MNRKVSIAIVVLVLFLTGGSLTFFFLSRNKKPESVPIPQPVAQKAAPEAKSAEPVDITSWKLYQNKQYGYEMKYPADWEIGTLHNVDPATFSAPDFSLPNCYQDGSGTCPSFMINNVHKVEPGETIKEDINLNTNDKIIAEKEMKISGEDASFIEYYQASYGRRDGQMGLVRQEMKVIHSGTLYRIDISEVQYPYQIKTSADWKYGSTYDAMLASFRFVDGTQENATGIIYTNKDFRFSVTLPLGWEKYQVSIQKDKGDANHTYIYFMMPTTDKSWSGSYDKNTGGIIPGMADIFVITATDLSTWNTDINSKECKENPNPSCPDAGSVVAKNGSYVFDASYGNGLLPPDVQKFRVGNSASKFLSGKFKLLD